MGSSSKCCLSRKGIKSRQPAFHLNITPLKRDIFSLLLCPYIKLACQRIVSLRLKTPGSGRRVASTLSLKQYSKQNYVIWWASWGGDIQGMSRETRRMLIKLLKYLRSFTCPWISPEAKWISKVLRRQQKANRVPIKAAKCWGGGYSFKYVEELLCWLGWRFHLTVRCFCLANEETKNYMFGWLTWRICTNFIVVTYELKLIPLLLVNVHSKELVGAQVN